MATPADPRRYIVEAILNRLADPVGSTSSDIEGIKELFLNVDNMLQNQESAGRMFASAAAPMFGIVDKDVDRRGRQSAEVLNQQKQERRDDPTSMFYQDIDDRLGTSARRQYQAKQHETAKNLDPILNSFKDAFPNFSESASDWANDPRTGQIAGLLPFALGGTFGRPRGSTAAPDIPANTLLPNPKTKPKAKVGGKQEGQIFPWVDAYVRTKDSHPDLAAKIDKYGTMAQNHLMERRVNEMTKKPVGIYEEIATMTGGHIQAIEVGDDIELVYETDESGFMMEEPRYWDHAEPDIIRGLSNQLDAVNSETVMMDRLIDDPQNKALKDQLMGVAKKLDQGTIGGADLQNYMTKDVVDFIESSASSDYDISDFRPDIFQGGVSTQVEHAKTKNNLHFFNRLINNLRVNPTLYVDPDKPIDYEPHIQKNRKDIAKRAEGRSESLQKYDTERATNLGNIWGDRADDMEMFQILPELKKLGIRMSDTGTSSGGHFSAHEKEAVVNSHYNWNRSEPVVTHETGHAIANQTGQPQGASPSLFSPAYSMKTAQDAIANNANFLFSLNTPKEGIDYINGVLAQHRDKYGGVDNRSDLIDFIAKENKKDPNFDGKEAAISFEQSQALKDVKNDLTAGIAQPRDVAKDLVTEYTPSNRQYMDTQGELTARVEEDRRSMTRKERAEYPYNNMLRAKSNVRPELRHLNYRADRMQLSPIRPFNEGNRKAGIFDDEKAYLDRQTFKDEEGNIVYEYDIAKLNKGLSSQLPEPVYPPEDWRRPTILDRIKNPELEDENGNLLPEYDRPPEPDYIFRGMSADEYKNFKKTGKIKSDGSYNFSSQKGLTYFTKDPRSAVSYANSFAPKGKKPTFEKPAYIVKIKRPSEDRVQHVQGVAEHEVGVMGEVDKSEVVGVYRGNVAAYTPETKNLNESSTVYWEKLEDENQAELSPKPSNIFMPDPKKVINPFEDNPLKTEWTKAITDALVKRNPVFDERFDKRVGQQQRLGELETIFDTPRRKPDPISIFDLEGKSVVMSMSDRTLEQGNMLGVKGTMFDEPIETTGGQLFPWKPERIELGHAWMSGDVPIADIIKKALAIEKETGVKPLLMPHTMTPSGGDFSKLNGELMIKYASANMDSESKLELNDAVRDYVSVGTVKDGVRKNHGLKIQGWKGVDHPDSIKAWKQTPDSLRKELKIKVFDKFRDKGGLSLGESRLALADSSQLFTPDGQLNSVIQLFPERGSEPSGDSTYPSSLFGEPKGQLIEQVDSFDILPQLYTSKGRPLDMANPSRMDRRLLELGAYTGIVDDKALRRIEERRKNR